MKTINTILMIFLIFNNGIFAEEFSTDASPSNLKKTIEDLTSIPNKNFQNINSLNKAANYIQTQFSKFGLKPYRQIFRVDSLKYKNIIVELGPENQDTIVIGAHYDTAEDTVGADDNASGVAGTTGSSATMRL
ncbi:peptidase, M28 domain protein [Leptospira weilii serovar Ranarum str. ICFT]|uniref:Peptidase, M28 domain protein n=1 Tax=Leptospira weilii serovar Ranarum str. ICFT TaxID=1218598 RepID=N1WA90_9LEPT|nr:M28 family peptidase [Leptospira weilii]EMY77166.1 peptidase, M28 domain protein [Leptospira weilii serovar Ranarum str. ICFT]